uniref:ATP synthase F0 subunit 6 n=1 Tax=Eucoleus annulatus TaxID=2831232 RepID=A0A8E8LQT1_9BILA|nr:ATP synthase F0 subunit 6 [Eucoleus annulatus]QWC93303.1 ATP synthase F0 subunit 6 [Eucoleus annulatus]
MSLLLLMWYQHTQSKILDEMMNSEIELMPLTWNSNNRFNAFMSLTLFIFLIFFMSKNQLYCSRWTQMLKKFTGLNYTNIYKEYMVIFSLCFIILLINFYSLFSFNWIPTTQNWFILIITTIFLLSIWLKMIMSGGLKLFGEKIPISWYILNFMIWCFHNLSYMIRFISLPFRMMMNLIVGMFLTDFVKLKLSFMSLISLYETFVMLVQSMVFIILANMYYSEMIMIPEWKSHPLNYKFNLGLNLNSWIRLIQLYIMKLIYSL